MVNVLVAAGKIADNDSAKGDSYAKLLEKLEADKDQVSKAVSNPQVAAEYKKLRGTKVTSTDDLAALAI